MRKRIFFAFIAVLFIIASCSNKPKMECFREKIMFGNVSANKEYWDGIICKNQDVKNNTKCVFNKNGFFFGISLRNNKSNYTRFIYFFDERRVSVEIDTNYNKKLYHYIAYRNDGTLFYEFARKLDKSISFNIRDNDSLFKNKDTITLDVNYKIDSVIGYHSIEQYVFIKGKLAKGKYYSIIDENKDSVLIKLTYSSMKYSTKNPNMTSIEYFKGDINKYPISYDKENHAIYIPEPIKSEAKIKDKHQFWLPKGDKYLVMFYTTKDTSRLLYTKKGIDYVYMDTIPLDYNLFIIDTHQDNSDIVKEFMRKLAFNNSMKYPGKLENRKYIQDMMVESGCYEYDNKGKLKLIINPLELLKGK